jgi:transposase
MREVPNALFYITRGGCAWRLLPPEFPKWQTDYHYYLRFRLSRAWARRRRRLRDRLRQFAGRAEQPTAVVINSQAVETTERGGVDLQAH